MAVITGTSGNDNLFGTASADTINGGAGNDSVSGADGSDSVVGGTGSDTLRGNNGTDWLEGGAGNDNVGGGAGQDSFVLRESGAANADLLFDFATGWDNIQLDAAAFTNIGATGRFSTGDARFRSAASAQDADDRIIFNGATGELFYDVDGNGAGAAQLIATLPSGRAVAASDFFVFGTPPTGGGVIRGTNGNDSLIGTAGDDTMEGLAGNDTMQAGLGNDTYVTESIADEFGNGNDTISDTGGVDTVIVEGSGGALRTATGVENLTIRGYNVEFGVGASGNALNNVIRDEGGGNTFIDGEGGNDTLIGSDGFQFFSFGGNFTPGVGSSLDYGHDTVDGRGGRDWFLLETNTAVVLDFSTGTMTGGAGGASASVTFTNIEAAVGTLFDDRMVASSLGNELRGYSGNDTLIGGSGNDRLDGDGAFDHPTGEFGNDSLVGGAGNDFLDGQEGDDTMNGGAGNDTLDGASSNAGEPSGADRFHFTVAPGAANADLITEFTSGTDKIVLDGNAHANSGASGNFAAGDGRFRVGTSAQDADDRVIYNSATGQLWYDADGNGAGTQQLIATLQGSPALAATDISAVNGSGGGTPAGVITGTPGNDSLTGTSGSDTIDGGAGADTMNGMGGNDTYIVTAGDVVQDSGGIDLLFAASSFALPSPIENITYTGTNSTASVGNSLSNAMTGNSGRNYMDGRGANDTLAGAQGIDTLAGGAGNDTFVFSEMGTANADNVTDFLSGTDRIVFDSVFEGVGTAGSFRSGAGVSSGQDADDRVVYDTSTGQLYYDADGSGSGASQLVATLGGAPGLAATDIMQ